MDTANDPEVNCQGTILVTQKAFYRRSYFGDGLVVG